MSHPYEPIQYAREQLARYAHQQAEKFEGQAQDEAGELDEVTVARAKEIAKAFRAAAREVTQSHSEGRLQL